MEQKFYYYIRETESGRASLLVSTKCRNWFVKKDTTKRAGRRRVSFDEAVAGFTRKWVEAVREEARRSGKDATSLKVPKPKGKDKWAIQRQYNQTVAQGEVK